MPRKKRKVEVGDIWQDNEYGHLLSITRVEDNYIEMVCKAEDGDFHMFYCNSHLEEDGRHKDFIRLHTYIGKTKYRIEQLFEVEEDGQETH